MSRPRLTPGEMWPTGVAGITARLVSLASGVRVRVVEGGPTAGPPVLFVHGWACSAYLFSRNIGPVAAAGYRALALDLVGHGLSDKPVIRGRYTLDAMVGDVFGALDALGLERATLVGQSMGGRIALEVALRAPERVSALVLFNSVGLARVRVLPLLRAASARVLAPLAPHVAFRWVFWLGLRGARGRLAAPTPRDVDEYWAPSQFGGYALAMHALLREFDWGATSYARLSRLRAPSLVVLGTMDRLVRLPALDALRRAAPAVTNVVLVEGAGHAVNEEAPEEANRAVAEFLEATHAGIARVTSTG